MQEPLRLDPEIIRLGLGWSQSWTDGPILCVITPDAIRFVVVSDRRFIASWEWKEETETSYRFFLIPPFIAQTLSSHTAYNINSLRARINRTHVALTVRDNHGEYVLQWRWRAASFEAPPFFDQMAQQPTTMLEKQTFMTIADAVHLAIANIGRLEAMEQIDREQLAIVINFGPGKFKIDGQPISTSDDQPFYFDPRLIIRGLEVVRGKHIGFAIAETLIPQQSILYLTSERDNWHVQCALLSLLPDEQTRIVNQRARSIAQTGLLPPRD
ncbi:hypothetical protein ACFLYO_07705 [Chloroflexota bacterium]